MRSSTEETGLLYNKKESVNSLKNQSHVTFFPHLRRMRHVEHDRSGNIPGTTAKQRACSNPHLPTLSQLRHLQPYTPMGIRLWWCTPYTFL
ncbi:hypothetical protein TNCV_1911301 [Trichonephila clavipes]|nr:hypothetical protein TNCV_1911301 [Trichonephila clavipes]